jgi:hypothetical protein
MTTDHPVAPTSSQIETWSIHPGSWAEVARTIYAAGADAELKEVGHWLISEGYFKLSVQLDACRRPVLLSLKERAQRIIAENGTTSDGRLELDADDRQIIEAALAELPD